MGRVKGFCWGLLAAVLGANAAMAVEEAEYTVVVKDKSFELRQYEPHVLAETLVNGAFDEAGNKAFRRLFNYISGNNTARKEVAMTTPVSQSKVGEKIAMTSPVGQQRDNGQWAVSFMMPASYSLATLPEPDDPSVTLRQVPARQVASIRYSGFWSQEVYEQHKQKLDEWIAAKGLVASGDAIWARYDPPMMPWFMRRNEILIPVANGR